MRGPAVVVLLGVLTAGCATRADVETLGDSLRADLEEIQEGNARLLAQIRGGLDSLELAESRRESTGRGEFERRVSRLEDMMDQLLEVTSQNNQLLNDLYQNQMAGGRARPGARPAGPVSGPVGDPALGTDEPSAFYAMALQQFRNGNLEAARGALEDFLTENPNHELAPEALYYVGRTWEEAGDIGNALAQYQRVTERYPDASRASTALYRRGLIEAGRGNTALARQLFQQILSGYPNNPEAELARDELEKLGG